MSTSLNFTSSRQREKAAYTFLLTLFLGAKAPLELVRVSGSVSNEKVSKQQDLLNLIEEL